MEFLSIMLILLYIYAGDKVIYYIKYNLLNVRAELYADTPSPCFIIC